MDYATLQNTLTAFTTGFQLGALIIGAAMFVNFCQNRQNCPKITVSVPETPEMSESDPVLDEFVNEFFAIDSVLSESIEEFFALPPAPKAPTKKPKALKRVNRGKRKAA